MTVEISLGPLRHSLSAPRNKYVLWKPCVWVFYFNKGELNLAFREILDQIRQFPFYYITSRSALLRVLFNYPFLVRSHPPSLL